MSHPELLNPNRVVLVGTGDSLTDDPNITFTPGGSMALDINAAVNIGGITTISVSSASTALRITQTGAGDALRVEDSANPDSSPFVVEFDGLVGIGVTDPDNFFANADNLVVGSGSGSNGITIFSGNASSNEFLL